MNVIRIIKRKENAVDLIKTYCKHKMKNIKTLSKPSFKTTEGKGCSECQTSCQSACKTSCTVANQKCESPRTHEREDTTSI